MAKHINWKIKYNYIMRYKKGIESNHSLGKELIEKGYSNDITEKNAYRLIWRWNKRFEMNGIQGLTSKTGLDPKKKKKGINHDYDDWTKEELIEHIKNISNFKNHNERTVREKYNYIKNNDYASTKKLCAFFGVSRSGYYNWIKNGSTVTGRYDKNILEKIKTIFKNKNSKYGFKRVKIELEREYNIHINEKTVLRYMKHLGLKANIRQPRKNREIKITHRSFKDLIRRDWKSETRHNKLYTDVSYIKTSKGWCYISVVLDGFNNEVVSWEFSESNTNAFVFKSIVKALRKIDDHSNVIIHSDHGFQYFSEPLKRFRTKLGFKQSMGRVGVSLDNRPIEYFFSVLKQEYLSGYVLNFENTKSLIEKSIYDYNNKRFQTCIKNMTPHEYAESYSSL